MCKYDKGVFGDYGAFATTYHADEICGYSTASQVLLMFITDGENILSSLSTICANKKH